MTTLVGNGSLGCVAEAARNRRGNHTAKLLARGHEVVCFADVVGDAKLQAVQGSECTEHDKEDSGHHDDEQHSPDPHLWLDPVLAQDLVRSAAQHVEVALKARGGWTEDEAMSMAARKDALLARVAAMDHEYRERLIDAKGKPIVTHHDAFARLAKRYDLRVAAVVRIGSSSESSPGDIAKVMSAVKESGARAIFREPQSNASGAERIAQLAGVKLLVLDPLGDGDWFTMMRANLDALCEGLGEEKSGVADQDAERK